MKGVCKRIIKGPTLPMKQGPGCVKYNIKRQGREKTRSLYEMAISVVLACNHVILFTRCLWSYWLTQFSTKGGWINEKHAQNLCTTLPTKLSLYYHIPSHFHKFLINSKQVSTHLKYKNKTIIMTSFISIIRDQFLKNTMTCTENCPLAKLKLQIKKHLI